MADARALLRAHRAENRITHPHAAYSDTGKLVCKLCRETVKSEALWEGHVRSANHSRSLAALQAQQQQQQQNTGTGDEERNPYYNSNKRKHDDVDESMSDTGAEEDGTAGAAGDSAAGPKKRSRTDTQTPPHLPRRTSNTPVQGVEIAIPSRPATPHAAGGSNSSTSTPVNLPVGAGGTSTPASFTSSGSNNHLRPNNNNNNNTTTTARAPTSAAQQHQQQQGPSNSGSGTIDESEWAAFEAEMAEADNAAPPTSLLPAYQDATISAPALTAEQVAAEEENQRRSRKTLLDTAIADEREDAAQRLEAEFDEMEELEGRVRRLKARREELLLLRRQGQGQGEKRKSREAGDGVFAFVGAGGEGSGNNEDEGEGKREGEGDDEDDDEDDEDEDEEYDVFRFRA